MCLLRPVAEPNGFKLDMRGPEGSIYPLFEGLNMFEVRGLKSKKWALCQKSGSEAKEFEHENCLIQNWIESDQMD